VEELFGEIEEHDLDEELIEKNWEMILIFFSARFDVEYLNQTYKLNIPESDSYGTLGGFIVDFTNDIPLKGEAMIGSIIY
jgi:CBS domain containing-hemolysin-like protein